METALLKRSIEAGIHYLHSHQRDTGNFRLWISHDPRIQQQAHLDLSPFAAACILYCLQWLQTDTVQQMRDRAIDFLCAEQDAQGFWRYYSSEQIVRLPGSDLPARKTIHPDLDTTSCASFILERYGRKQNNRGAFTANRNPEGLFFTWLLDAPMATDDFLPFLCMIPVSYQNNICCGVNANVLLYLGEGEDTRQVSSYLQTVFQSPRLAENTAYYSDEIVLFYLYSRACAEGAQSLRTLQMPMLNRLLAWRQPDGSFGTPLRTAMAVCTLQNFENDADTQAAAVRSLAACQNADGSWPRAPFYSADTRKTMQEICFAGTRHPLPVPADDPGPYHVYFGSEEITTAYCLEALSRFAEAA